MEATMKRKKYHYPNDLKEDLLLKGIEIMNTEGIDKLTLKALATSLGVTSAAMYHHYADKTALFIAIVQRRLTELNEELNEKVFSQNTDDAVLMLVKISVIFYQFCESKPDFLLLLNSGILDTSKEATPREKARKDEDMRDFFDKLLEAPLAAVKHAQEKKMIVADNPYNVLLTAFSGPFGFLGLSNVSNNYLKPEQIHSLRVTFMDIVFGSMKNICTNDASITSKGVEKIKQDFIANK